LKCVDVFDNCTECNNATVSAMNYRYDYTDAACGCYPGYYETIS